MMMMILIKRTAITSAQLARLYHIPGHRFAIISPAYHGHQVNEHGGQVVLDAILRSGVIPRKGVVVVVEALADGAEVNEEVLRRRDALVIRPLAPHVRRAVHQPGHVQHEAVSQDGAHEEAVPKRLAPQIAGIEGRQEEAESGHQRKIETRGTDEKRRKQGYAMQ